jgi:hypothetical protein
MTMGAVGHSAIAYCVDLSKNLNKCTKTKRKENLFSLELCGP